MLGWFSFSHSIIIFCPSMSLEKRFLIYTYLPVWLLCYLPSLSLSHSTHSRKTFFSLFLSPYKKIFHFSVFIFFFSSFFVCHFSSYILTHSPPFTHSFPYHSNKFINIWLTGMVTNEAPLFSHFGIQSTSFGCYYFLFFAKLRKHHAITHS